MKNVIQESKHKRKYSFSEVIWVKELIHYNKKYSLAPIYTKCHWKHSQSMLAASN